MACRVAIQGVSCDGPEGQLWAMVSGPTSPEIPITFSDKVEKELIPLASGPIQLEIEGEYLSAREFNYSRFKFEGLYLYRQGQKVSPSRSTWYMVDARAYMSEIWVYADFNLRRPANDFKRFGEGFQANLNQVPIFSYLPHTLKKIGALEFGNVGDDYELLEPWTAFNALQYFLTTWIKKNPGRVNPPGESDEWFPDVDFSKSRDNGVVLSEFRANRPLPVVLGYLLGQSYTRLFVAPDTRWVVFSEDTSFPSGLGGYQGAGFPRLPDVRGAMPRKIRTYTRKRQELRLDYFEYPGKENATIEKGTRDVSLTLENVLILPGDVKEKATGRTYRRGTIVPIEKALELWNQDPDNPLPELITKNGKTASPFLSLDLVRRTFFSTELATRLVLSFRYVTSKDQVWAARASTLYGSYRQMFRINPYLFEMMDSVDLYRSGVVEGITGHRLPSPVFVDHWVEFSERYFLGKAIAKDTQRNFEGGMNRYAWGGALSQSYSTTALPISKANNGGDFELKWVNRKLGVFSYSRLSDVEGNTVRHFPFTVEAKKAPLALLGGLLKQWLVSQCKLEPVWRFSTIVSVTQGVPNDNSRMFFMDFDSESDTGGVNTQADARGPNVERFSGATFAEYEWTDDSRLDLSDGGFKIEGSTLSNEFPVKEVCKAVAKGVIFGTQPRVRGQFKAPGYDELRDFPKGAVNSVIVRNSNGKVESIHDSSAPPRPAPFYSVLPESVAAFLFRQESEPPR